MIEMDQRQVKQATGILIAIISLTSALYIGNGGSSNDDDAREKLFIEPEQQEPVLEFRGVDIPKVFIVYDLNSDHKISLTELSEVTSTEKENARRPFEEADSNGDQYLTVEEFTRAPWLFDANEIVVKG